MSVLCLTINLRHVYQIAIALLKQLTMLLDLLKSTKTHSVCYCLMVADTTLKSLYSKLFYVTRIAHLLHNCAMKAKFHFEEVDQLDTTVKPATVKNKTRQARFATVGDPPQPVATRCGSWLSAALCYANTLPEVKAIVESYERSGIVVT